MCDQGRERDDARALSRPRDHDARAARATGSRAAARAVASAAPTGKAASWAGARMRSIARAHTRPGCLETRSSAQGCGTTRSTYRIAARSDHHASQREADSAAAFDVPQLLIRDDLRTQPVLIKSNSARSDEIGPVDQVFVSVSSRRRRKAWRQFRSALCAEKHGLAGTLHPHERHGFAARRIGRAPNPRTASPILSGDSRNTRADGPR